MAKMKIEVQAARARAKGVPLRDRLVAEMPRYARLAALMPWTLRLRNRVPMLARLGELLLGLSAERSLPEFRRDWFRTRSTPREMREADVVLFADSFNRYFEPENLRAAETVLQRAGLKVAHATAPEDGRPLCCGRTYLSAGMAAQAKAEMARTVEAIRPALEAGATVVGLEPSCVMTFRDEAPALLDGWTAEMGTRIMLFEEFLAERADAGTLELPLGPLAAPRALLHGHCHQKAFNVMGPVQKVLRLVPGLKVDLIASSCCGMAGAFGYQAETIEVSRAMGELSLLPKVRAAEDDAIVVADGTSCRHQIADGAEREAVHVARVLLESTERAAI
jgi:Fe-S oxidoreductase